VTAPSSGLAGSAGSSGSYRGVVLNRIRNWLERFICPMDSGTSTC
jgi:hypothetical protein